MIPLIKKGVICKTEPNRHSLLETDELRVNDDFKSNLYKMQIAVLTSKMTKEQENNRLEGKVEDDRRYTIEANIIKVMKARRRLDFPNLVSEAIKLLSQKFTPDSNQVKLRIESLIERGYIEREESDKRVLIYKA